MSADKPAKPLSSKIMQLKFMQRVVEREKIAEQKIEEKKKEEAEQWATPDAAAKVQKRRVIYEGDPKPGALVGRLSFNSFSPTTERIGAEAEAERAALRAALRAAAAGGGGAGGESQVSDSEMAGALGGKRKGGPEAGAGLVDEKGFRKPPADWTAGKAAAGPADGGQQGPSKVGRHSI